MKDAIMTILATSFVYGWIYGEKTYNLIIGKEDDNENSRRKIGTNIMLYLRENE